MISSCRFCISELNFDDKCEKCAIKYSTTDSGSFLMLKPNIAVYFLHFSENFVELSMFDKNLPTNLKMKKLNKFDMNHFTFVDIKKYCVKYMENSVFA